MGKYIYIYHHVYLLESAKMRTIAMHHPASLLTSVHQFGRPYFWKAFTLDRYIFRSVKSLKTGFYQVNAEVLAFSDLCTRKVKAIEVAFRKY